MSSRATIELPFGDDPGHCWIARRDLTDAQVNGLHVPLAELEQAITYGLPTKTGVPSVRGVEPGRGGGGDVEELPKNGTHVARYLERITNQDANTSLGRIRTLAETAGQRLVGMPLQATSFTKPGSSAADGISGHTDPSGGFLAVMLVGRKHFDLLPTACTHPFGDSAAAAKNLEPHAIIGERIRVTLEPGDVMYVGNHVLHWVSNDFGITQHLRLSYPIDVWTDGLSAVLQHHRERGYFSQNTIAQLDAATMVAPETYDEYLQRLDALDAALNDLLDRGQLSGPDYDLAYRFRQPECVLSSIQFGLAKGTPEVRLS